MPGTLFVVATPIGNLEDITYRAVRILREVDLVAAEDTRRTAKLLARYEIERPLLSLREHNEVREASRIVSRIEKGESVALVTDAGTPAIADPGAHLVRRARAAGLPVTPVPGPNAVATALSVSGFESSQFAFLGFPPSGGAARERWLEELALETKVVVFFESPHRIRRTLDEVGESVKRPIVLTRELTKMNEEFVVQPTATGDGVREQGEFVVVVDSKVDASGAVDRLQQAVDSFWQITQSVGLSDEALLRVLAMAFGVPNTRIASRIRKERIARKRAENGQP